MADPQRPRSPFSLYDVATNIAGLAQYAGEQLLSIGRPGASNSQQSAGLPDPPIKRAPSLSEAEWLLFFDDEGRFREPAKLRMRVYTGGAQPAVRGALWEFLLGVYKWNSTFEERGLQQHQNSETYNNYLSVYHALKFTAAEQEMATLIDKDIVRTDRDVEFFAGDGNPNIEKLGRILGIFSMLHRPDMPYVQGMNEFASMLLYVADGREADAFWMFDRLMRFHGAYFQPEEQTAMNRQFQTLLQLLSDVEPSVYQHLSQREANDVLFAYRWLLLNLKREFGFHDSLLVQETIWSMPVAAYIDNRLDLGQNPYALFLALAVFIIEAPALKNMDYDDILLHMNGLARKLDVDTVLRVAEYRYWIFVRGRVPDDRLDPAPNVNAPRSPRSPRP